MGEIVGAGLLAHVPTVMLPLRRPAGTERGQGDHPRHRPEATAHEVFETARTTTRSSSWTRHWATTVEFVVTAQQRRAGLFTSEELPRGMCRMPYDLPRRPGTAPP